MLKKFEDLAGKVLSQVYQKDDEELIFVLETGERYKLYHSQECCELVTIEDINGDLNDLISSPITLAEESTSEYVSNSSYLDLKDVDTLWTFYRLATVKGYVTIRWFGASNGYYSVEVDFAQIEN